MKNHFSGLYAPEKAFFKHTLIWGSDYHVLLLMAGLECFSACRIRIKRRFLRFLHCITNKLQTFS